MGRQEPVFGQDACLRWMRKGLPQYILPLLFHKNKWGVDFFSQQGNHITSVFVYFIYFKPKNIF
ncbi:hypothetical protein C7120_04160 [Prevotella sp. oral taxon 376]|nr:hypothetical protein C7120_04160 [Prevotella sp. oral taxon 376]